MSLFHLFLKAFLLAGATNGHIIHDCDSFHAWFDREPARQLTLGARDVINSGPMPKHGPDSIAFDESAMTYFHGFVGGGGMGAHIEQGTTSS